MGQSSIKKNYVLNLINTLTGLVFPLITFPYASRILFADGIGQVQFFQSIIDYIALCSALGIPLYAVREIARYRDNIPVRNKITVEILLLHTLLTLTAYIVIAILAVTVKKIEINIPLFLLLSVTLLFNTIGVTWFYQAVEDFKYITIRSLFMRIFSLIALFVFVRTQNDLLYYAGITVMANVGGNIFNFFRLRKFIHPKEISFRNLSLLKHLKPALQIFVLNLTISIYVNLDSVMLGFIRNEEAVGYYTAATKLTKAILSIISSLGLVLLPRFSNMISNGEFTEFKSLANKVVSFTIAYRISIYSTCPDRFILRERVRTVHTDASVNLSYYSVHRSVRNHRHANIISPGKRKDRNYLDCLRSDRQFHVEHVINPTVFPIWSSNCNDHR